MKTTTFQLAILSLVSPAFARLDAPRTAGSLPSNTASERNLSLSEASSSASSLVLDAIKSTSADDYLTSFLESDECDAFVEGLSDGLAGLVFKYDDDTIREFACNAIERQKLADFEEEMSGEIAHHETGVLTCRTAYEMKLSETMPLAIEALSSDEACKEEMDKELLVVRSSVRRALNEDSGRGAQRERMLPGPLGLAFLAVRLLLISPAAY